MGKNILTFGTFDPLHDGHRDLFRQARALGDSLHVVVARDAVVLELKGHEASVPEEARVHAVSMEPLVTSAELGAHAAGDYSLLKSLSFDVLAVGYDQQPDDEAIRTMLRESGQMATVCRLQPYRPDVHKSSKIRGEE